MRESKILLFILLLCLLTGCTSSENSESNITKNQVTETKTNLSIVESFTGDGGYILENNIYDYSQRFSEVYTWMDGVKLPIDKPDGAEIVFQDGVQIMDFDDSKFETYVKDLEKQNFTLVEYSAKEEEKQAIVQHRYLLYKDNLIVIFDKTEEYINVHITTGNVAGERDVSVTQIKEWLGEEYSEYIPIEVAHPTVAEAGYSEFILISPEHYDLYEYRMKTYYVVANKEEILLCKEGIWNQAFPMTAILIKEEGKEELVINFNDPPQSRSGASIYPGLHIYETKNGKFVEKEIVDLPTGNVIIGVMGNNSLKYYIVEENEEYEYINGRKDYWQIKEEYVLESDTVE